MGCKYCKSEKLAVVTEPIKIIKWGKERKIIYEYYFCLSCKGEYSSPEQIQAALDRLKKCQSD